MQILGEYSQKILDQKVTVFMPAGTNMLRTFSFELELDIGAMIFNIISISDWMFNLNLKL